MRVASCPVEITMRVIDRKWKPVILWKLRDECFRFSELHARIPGVSHKVLVELLRELERDGLVARRAMPGGGRRVEYALTALGESLRPVLDVMNTWGEAHDPCGAGGPAAEGNVLVAGRS